MMKNTETPWIDENGFYSYLPLSGYNAYIYIICGARDIGKTFTRRLETIRDCIANGYNFVNLVRHKEQIKGSDGIQVGYFDKLAPFFPDHVFKVEGVHGYFAAKSDANENGKIPKSAWRHLCYFVALSESQNLKERTFVNVRDVIFDEFIIEKSRYHRYLDTELEDFWRVLKSLDRINPDGTHLNIRVWLLANACNLANPYLVAFGITAPPDYGYKWLDKELGVVFHFVPPFEHKKKNMSRTEKLIAKYSKDAQMVFDNKFLDGGADFVKAKPSSAKFQYAMSLYGEDFGVWYDLKTSYLFINRKIPANSKYNFVLSLDDMDNDTVAIERTSAYCQQVASMAMAGRVWYDSPVTRETFGNILKWLGVK